MRKRHFTEVDTMPLPGIGHRLPTIQQLRESHNMSYFEVAQAAGVHPRVVYWVEHGIRISLAEAISILAVFSRCSQHPYTFHNVWGIRLKRLSPPPQKMYCYVL